MLKTEARTPPSPPPVPPGPRLGAVHTSTQTYTVAALWPRGKLTGQFPRRLKLSCRGRGLGRTPHCQHTDASRGPRKQGRPRPTHLLLQTDAELLGGQRGPRWGRLGGRGQPAGVQVPKLLVISVETTEAQLSAGRGAASGPRVLPGHTPHKHLHPF